MQNPAFPLSPQELLDHAGFLRALARGLVGEAGAEDVVQETWLSALRRPPSRGRPLRPWLATVTRRLASNAIRRERRAQEHQHAAVEPPAPFLPDEALERLEWQRKLLEHVLALREPYRKTIVQRYYEELGPAQIAERNGVPVKTVKTRLSRGLAELRARLDEGPGGRAAWIPALAVWACPTPLLRGGAGVLVDTAAAETLGIAGALLMKKLMIAVIVAMAGWIVVRGLRWPSVLEPGGDPRSAAPKLGVMPRNGAAPVTPSLPDHDDRSAVDAVLGSREPTRGELVLQLRSARHGSALPGVGVDLICWGDPAPRTQYSSGTTDAGGRVGFAAQWAGKATIQLDRGHTFTDEVVAGTSRLVELELPADVEIEGRVVDTEGQPIVGAGIWVTGSRGNLAGAWRLAVSGRGGSFRLSDLARGARFGARADGHRPSVVYEAGLLPVGALGVREVVLALGPLGGGAAGRVLDPDGRPLAGALVKIGERGGFHLDSLTGPPAYEPDPIPMRTDEEGAFIHPGDLAPAVHPVHAVAPGWPLWSGALQVIPGESAWIEIRLAPSARVAGRVVTQDGEPVARVRVQAASADGEYGVGEPFPSPRTETDALGRFELDWLPGGNLGLHAFDPEHPRLGRGWTSVSCTGGETSEVELVLELGRTIGGKVVDEAGHGLGGWRVAARPEGWRDARTRQDITDADGAFLLTNLDDGEWELIVGKRGGYDPVPHARAAGLRAGRDDLVLVVDSADLVPSALRGRLIGVDGRAPRDIRLLLFPDPASSGFGIGVEVDEVDGRFIVQTSFPGAYLLRAMRGMTQVAEFGPYELVSGEELAVHDLRIEAPGRVEAVIRDEDGEVRHDLRPMLLRSSWPYVDLHLEGGVFRSPDLAPGSWTLGSAFGGPWFLADMPVEVATGQTVRLEATVQAARRVWVVVAFSEAGGVPAVFDHEVLDERGNLVHRAHTLQRPSLDKGHLHLQNLWLPDGVWRIQARTDDGRRGSIILVVGESTAETPWVLQLH